MGMRCCSYKQTNADKINDLKETRLIDEHLIKHYTFILEHFDEVIAAHDADIAKIEDKKADVLKQFVAAPEQLIILGDHLTMMQEKIKSTKDATSNITAKKKRLKSLRERFAKLQAECEAEGIDISKETGGNSFPNDHD